MRLIDSSVFVSMGIFIIEYLEYFHLDRALTVSAFVSFYYVAMALGGKRTNFYTDDCYHYVSNCFSFSFVIVYWKYDLNFNMVLSH